MYFFFLQADSLPGPYPRGTQTFISGLRHGLKALESGFFWKKFLQNINKLCVANEEPLA